MRSSASPEEMERDARPSVSAGNRLAGGIHGFALQDGPANIAVGQQAAENPIFVHSTKAPVPALSRKAMASAIEVVGEITALSRRRCAVALEVDLGSQVSAQD